MCDVARCGARGRGRGRGRVGPGRAVPGLAARARGLLLFLDFSLFFAPSLALSVYFWVFRFEHLLVVFYCF